jgi:hypothetical protein
MKHKESTPDIESLAHTLSAMGPLRLRDDRGGKYRIVRYVNTVNEPKTVVRGLRDAKEVHEWMLKNGKILMECIRSFFSPYLDSVS